MVKREMARILTKSIIYYSSKGYTNKEIAIECSCDRNTVSVYRHKFKRMSRKDFDMMFKTLFNNQTIPIYEAEDVPKKR